MASGSIESISLKGLEIVFQTLFEQTLDYLMLLPPIRLCENLDNVDYGLFGSSAYLEADLKAIKTLSHGRETVDGALWIFDKMRTAQDAYSIAQQTSTLISTQLFLSEAEKKNTIKLVTTLAILWQLSEWQARTSEQLEKGYLGQAQPLIKYLLASFVDGDETTDCKTVVENLVKCNAVISPIVSRNATTYALSSNFNPLLATAAFLFLPLIIYAIYKHAQANNFHASTSFMMLAALVTIGGVLLYKKSTSTHRETDNNALNTPQTMVLHAYQSNNPENALRKLVAENRKELASLVVYLHTLCPNVLDKITILRKHNILTLRA